MSYYCAFCNKYVKARYWEYYCDDCTRIKSLVKTITPKKVLEGFKFKFVTPVEKKDETPDPEKPIEQEGQTQPTYHLRSHDKKASHDIL